MDVSARVTVLPGEVWWASPDPAMGREQGGRRPVLVISNEAYLDAVATLAITAPLTTRDRGWPNHVPVAGSTGLDVPCWAMTEQVRTISRSRMVRRSGVVAGETLATVRQWVTDFLAE